MISRQRSLLARKAQPQRWRTLRRWLLTRDLNARLLREVQVIIVLQAYALSLASFPCSSPNRA